MILCVRSPPPRWETSDRESQKRTSRPRRMFLGICYSKQMLSQGKLISKRQELRRIKATSLCITRKLSILAHLKSVGKSICLSRSIAIKSQMEDWTIASRTRGLVTQKIINLTGKTLRCLLQSIEKEWCLPKTETVLGFVVWNLIARCLLKKVNKRMPL